MSLFEFSKLRTVKILPIDNEYSGDVTHRFKEFSVEDNLMFIREFFEKHGFEKNEESEKLMLELAIYPSTFTHIE